MDTISVNKFRDNLKMFVEQVVNRHLPLKVTHRNGKDFVVMSAEDWEREQETLYVCVVPASVRDALTPGCL